MIVRVEYNISLGKILIFVKLPVKIFPTTTEKVRINVTKLAGAYFNALYQK